METKQAEELAALFANSVRPIEKSISLKFKVSNDVVFEIEVNSRGDVAFNDQVIGIVEQAVFTAVSNLK